MKYFIIIILAFSLSSIAVGVSLSKDVNNTGKVLQQKTQKTKELEQKIQKYMLRGCDPQKELHMGPFN